MRLFISVVCVLLLTSCAGTTGNSPLLKQGKPVFSKGTYMPGSNITEPRPVKSRLLSVEHGGFVILESGAAYYLHAVLNEPLTSNVYLRIEYENPRDREHPFVNDMELTPETRAVRFSSPDVVWGIQNYKDYTIRVTAFSSRQSSEPIDSLVQPVRAYVDTTTDKVRVFEGMQPR